MTCPHCGEKANIIKKGSFARKTGADRRVDRFFCRSCRRHFSANTHAPMSRQRRPELEMMVFALLISGVSQRRTARLLSTTQTTVARKLVRLGAAAAVHGRQKLLLRPKVRTIVFDEMETFEHSKCKPVSIALAVEEGSRRILAVQAAQMPAKGRLAAISRKKYGPRADHRRGAVSRVLSDAGALGATDLTVKSDQCPRYPGLIKKVLPRARHVTFKGRRGCVVGQGELKRGGFDPLFSLNQSCAMVRDNVKRLSRRTWCTTKRIDRLQCLLNIYAYAHNTDIDRRERRSKRHILPPILPLPAADGRRSDVEQFLPV